MATSQRAPIPSVVTFPADPILSAIAVHRQGWATFANASPETIDGAAIVQRAALANLLGTPCTTRAGAESLLRHLRACVAANGSTLSFDAPAAGFVTARACDLALLLDLPAACAPPPIGAKASTAGLALNRAGEAMAAIAIIMGGVVLTGLASLL